MRNGSSRDELTSPKDELSEDKLNAASGGWPSSVSGGLGWSTSGSGRGLVLGGITGESMDKRHVDDIIWY